MRAIKILSGAIIVAVYAMFVLWLAHWLTVQNQMTDDGIAGLFAADPQVLANMRATVFLFFIIDFICGGIIVSEDKGMLLVLVVMSILPPIVLAALVLAWNGVIAAFGGGFSIQPIYDFMQYGVYAIYPTILFGGALLRILYDPLRFSGGISEKPGGNSWKFWIKSVNIKVFGVSVGTEFAQKDETPPKQ